MSSMVATSLQLSDSSPEASLELGGHDIPFCCMVGFSDDAAETCACQPAFGFCFVMGRSSSVYVQISKEVATATLTRPAAKHAVYLRLSLTWR
jgi:hypothetical protein